METVKIGGVVHAEDKLIRSGELVGLLRGKEEPLIDFVNRLEAVRHYHSWGTEYNGPRIEEDLDE